MPSGGRPSHDRPAAASRPRPAGAS
jgi:hypothetical protein